jgi:2-polyprenyl-6-methoxyphenol hydroxylase-like FAD-dependent oxidoreductase
MPDEDLDVDVLVVGAGPAGLVAGIALSRYGVRVLLVDKREEISTLSRSLVISTRCMEILRAWGLEDDVRSGAADVEPLGWVTETLASGEGAVIPLGYPTSEESAKISPTRPAWAPQDHLEPLLLALLQQTPKASVRFGCELESVRQEGDAAVATLRDDRSGQSVQVRARYLIGADGAHSAVRQETGIELEGRDDLAEYHRVEFQAPLWGVVGDRRYGLNLITHSDAGGAMTPRGKGDRWSLAREWIPGQPRMDELSPDQLRTLLATAAGIPDLRPKIERLNSFAFAAQLADEYRRGRVFLVGDAAHRTTPRGGTGMNMAIQDAFDLAWKLGWVFKGWADTELLETYEAERRPVAAHNVARTANPNGAQQQADEALPWDLNGRVQHVWLERDGSTISTLDLIGEGLTLFRGPDGNESTQAAGPPTTPAPVVAHTLDAHAAKQLNIPVGGAILLRPDGIPMPAVG